MYRPASAMQGPTTGWRRREDRGSRRRLERPEDLRDGARTSDRQGQTPSRSASATARAKAASGAPTLVARRAVRTRKGGKVRVICAGKVMVAAFISLAE